MWQGSEVVDLGVLPGGEWSTAEGIDEQGKFVGWSGNQHGTNQAVMWADGQVIGWSGGGSKNQHTLLSGRRAQFMTWARYQATAQVQLRMSMTKA